MAASFFEDMEVGRETTFGRHVVDRDDMVAFARRFDAQPFHLDEAAAANSSVGHLIGSGWYSCALQMRMLCDAWFSDTASLGGPGVEELRWIRPVAAGDILSVRQVILDKRLLASRPGVGMLRFTLDLLKADGERAMSCTHLGLVASRDRAPGPIAVPPERFADPRPAFPPEDPATAPRVFDEVEIGRGVDLGVFRFTAEDVVDFARRFDPQFFHTSREGAQRGPFGALAASGWHTAAAWMACFSARLNRLAETGGRPAVSVSPGFRDLRWTKPVYAGETIRFTTVPVAKRPLASRPGWGLVSSRNTGLNGHGEEVFSFTGNAFWQIGAG